MRLPDVHVRRSERLEHAEGGRPAVRAAAVTLQATSKDPTAARGADKSSVFIPLQRFQVLQRRRFGSGKTSEAKNGPEDKTINRIS